MKKWTTLAVYAAAFVLAYTYKDELIAWVTGNPPLWILILLSTVLAVFPIMPYRLVIAAAGYMMGALGGGLVTLIGSTLAGALLYWGSAYGFRDAAQTWTARIKPLKAISKAIDRRPFEAIVICKLIPVLPQTPVNIYAGAYGIPFFTYLSASVFGKLPSVFLYAFLGASLFSRPWIALGSACVYMLFLLLVLWVYRKRRKGNHIASFGFRAKSDIMEAEVTGDISSPNETEGSS
ncbi:TVP38/TMEM64 family protein [Paenibacillus vini]|uniref:TVP38/TMEM64 family protein n=1 Tax=Paenibacillus vini TaxID=1476024 RepID=UPI0025B706DA|nr:TVP38/TMEM64 family protein [Paenibacillus vini]MDN4067323.1 TVP38/TMEM64 family protein [Paenibacillus vini]